MTVENFERALRAFVRRKPFVAFLVEFVTGERIRIPHPEAIILYDELVVFFAPDLSRRVFDAQSVSQFVHQSSASHAP